MSRLVPLYLFHVDMVNGDAWELLYEQEIHSESLPPTIIGLVQGRDTSLTLTKHNLGFTENGEVIWEWAYVRKVEDKLEAIQTHTGIPLEVESYIKQMKAYMASPLYEQVKQKAFQNVLDNLGRCGAVTHSNGKDYDCDLKPNHTQWHMAQLATGDVLTWES